jgi:hypothetical protein
MGRETPVAGEAGERRRIAEILLPAQAKEAVSARPSEPRHPDTIADSEVAGLAAALDHSSDNLVAGNNRQRPVNVAVRDMQIGPANPTGGYFQQQFVIPRLGDRPGFQA